MYIKHFFFSDNVFVSYIDSNRTSLGAKAEIKCRNGFIPLSSRYFVTNFLCNADGWKNLSHYKNYSDSNCISNTICKNINIEVISRRVHVVLKGK